MQDTINESSGALPMGAACKMPLTPAQLEHRGLAWVIGAFLICPCHLPITLWVAGALLGGTALGAALRNHPIIAGTIITIPWAAATWYGFYLMRLARTYAARVTRART